MKTRILQRPLFLSVSAVILAAISLSAETPTPATTTDPSTPTAPPQTVAPAEATAPKLPYGVDDVLKLSRAQVNDDVTLNYIQNSGTTYNLAPKDIIYLKSEGVSDQVIKAMSDQQRNVPAQAAMDSSMAMQPMAPAPTGPDGTVTTAPAPFYAQPVPVYLQPVAVPVPVSVQPEPQPAPSTVYVIPDPASGAATPFYPSGYLRTSGSLSTVYTFGGPGGYHRGYGHRHGVYIIGRR